MDKPKIELKNTMGRNEVITYLEGLVEGFKAGKIVLEQGYQILEMTVPEVVQVEVEAKQKKDKAKFALELTWYQIADPDECDSVKISGQNPEKAVLAAGFEEVGDKEPTLDNNEHRLCIDAKEECLLTITVKEETELESAEKESDRLLRIGEEQYTS
ncbi:MAG: amphi-Trp domain-containing protein [Deltaproteobacteria bacterium]|nr:amphi-Trp domain-containing protein [Deltaproteobacteria bacterium]MBF0523495.1 amphi-Trp domain-containing protein [Deltaproteobacteria bacterium]